MIYLPWPPANEVHIHCLDLTAAAARYISPDERRRADRLLDPGKRVRFMTGRALLRDILGRYLRIRPEELSFGAGAQGKPRLSGDVAGGARLHFNLSYSGTCLLLAIAADREVGIDVEERRDDTPFVDMAHLAFSPREQEELLGLPDHLQRSAFYRCWTRKEAVLKAWGTGFTLRSNSFEVGLVPETPVSVSAPDSLSSLILQDITVPEGYCAALAVEGCSPVLRYFD